MLPRNGTTSASSNTPTLRPRTRRLISGLDEGDEISFDPHTAPKRIASPVTGSLLDQRPVSPIPPGHLPRPTSNYDRRITSHPQERVRGLAGNTTSLERFWGASISAFSGLAADLLGNDTQPPLAKGKVPRKRRQDSATHRFTTNVSKLAWGPGMPSEAPTLKDVGTGTKEEATAEFRARKRIDLLESHEATYVDTLGRHKRRTSDEAVSEAQHRDALVYIHHVQKGDTLAGITLRYDCSAEVVRRTNRMWPNDPIQSRTTILLPVDGCGAKGRPVSGPDQVDLLGDENAPIPAGLAESTSSLTVNGTRHRSNSNLTATTARSSSVARSSIESWQHDSWVLLPGTTKPVEILRGTRDALGYFPARRKSQTFSDIDSPKSSMDRPRGAATEALSTTSRSPARPNTSRRVSVGHTNFPPFMAGPGGVGTMDKTVRAPGPAPDSLNLYFAKHLPDVAPPRNQHALYQPELPLYTDNTTPTMSGHTTPSAGTNNLEHMGSAIESWMRRVASKAKEAATTAERQRAARASVGAPGKGAGGIGDLIEMTDEFEIGDDENIDNEYDRGRAVTAIAGPSSSGYLSGGARQRGKSGKVD